VEAAKVEAPVVEPEAKVEEKPAQKAWIPPSEEPTPGKAIPVDKTGITVETKKQAPDSPAVAAKMDPADDSAGKALSLEAVKEIMDEMVRPALQGDGGDITLIKVENNDIFVKLVGACSTCPSSIMTMKKGVEALLKEEFPMMGSLIQVDG
jgi:Fe-S cluster biogenesis protein NfuA